MTVSFTSINWLGVLLAFITYSLLGAIWFTGLFKKQYAIALGKENQMPEKPAPIFIIGPVPCILVITIATAVMMEVLAIDNYPTAALFSAIVGIGYLVANTFNIAINPNIPKPILYGLITSSYHLVGIFIVSIILLAMNK